MLITRCRWMVDCCSACTEMMSAPALAKSGTRCSGSTIICAATSTPRHHCVNCAVLCAAPLNGQRHEAISLGPPRCRRDARRIMAQACAGYPHQMAVQDLVGHGADSVHDERADGDVWHKAAVHHVHVHPVAASLVNGLDLWSEEEGGRWWQHASTTNDAAHRMPGHSVIPSPAPSPFRVSWVSSFTPHRLQLTSAPSVAKLADRMEGETMISLLDCVTREAFAATERRAATAGRLAPARMRIWVANAIVMRLEERICGRRDVVAETRNIGQTRCGEV